MPSSTFFSASALYLKSTPRNSTVPSATWFTATSAAGETMAGTSSSTSRIRSMLVKARASSKKTFEIIISEFMTKST